MAEQEIGTVLVETRGQPVAHQAEETRSEGQIMDLIKMAIDKDVDVSVLERLVALKERVTDKAARSAFFEALARFQEECPEIVKEKKVDYATREGGSVKYNYAPLEQIARTIRPLLRKHGLSYNFTAAASSQPNTLDVICVLRHLDGHEERATFPVPIDTNAKMNATQRYGAALTYGRRQTLIAVLGITTAETDTDAVPEIPGYITPEMIEQLNNKITHTGADINRFLKFMKVSSMEFIPIAKFEEAMRALDDVGHQRATRRPAR